MHCLDDLPPRRLPRTRSWPRPGCGGIRHAEASTSSLSVSEAQIAMAIPHESVDYVRAGGEDTGLPDDELPTRSWRWRGASTTPRPVCS